ncbi:hypothetical protein AAT19DRAFT_16826 [Rhodotorula toruloides]|uniref:Uncharacterized protein n=1 Tax=Rhodotorula toruloides TaxID=5286 RepID=A0A2T0A4F9_RHOTO|nr:hypothetical protein AAT19DRAFT_16826 [Rhodotorula toruloides]
MRRMGATHSVATPQAPCHPSSAHQMAVVSVDEDESARREDPSERGERERTFREGPPRAGRAFSAAFPLDEGTTYRRLFSPTHARTHSHPHEERERVSIPAKHSNSPRSLHPTRPRRAPPPSLSESERTLDPAVELCSPAAVDGERAFYAVSVVEGGVSGG